MKSTGRVLVGLVALVSGLLWIAPRASADFIVHRWENHFTETGIFRTKLEGLYYTTTGNFDSAGTQAAVPGLSSYNRFQGDLTLSVGLFPHVSLFGRANWMSVNQTGATRSGTAFGFGDQTLGANIHLFSLESGTPSHKKLSQFVLQLQADFPLYSNSTADSLVTPYLGDSSTDWTAGLFFIHPLHFPEEDGFELQIGSGYTYRNLNFSGAIPYNFGFAYKPVKTGTTGAIGAAGTLSLRNDPSGTSAVARSSLGSAGSLITGGTNASVLQVFGKIGYQVSPDMEFMANASLILWGQSAPNGYNISIGFNKHFGSTEHKRALQTESEYGKANRGFVNYSLDAKVEKSNDRLNIFKIDKGQQEGVEVGQIFDIFIVKPDGSQGEPVARAEVTHTKLNEAALEITEYFENVPIDQGFLARRVVVFK